MPIDGANDITIECAFSYPTLLPPELSQKYLRILLKIFILQTQFQYQLQFFIQTDGVSVRLSLWLMQKFMRHIPRIFFCVKKRFHGLTFTLCWQYVLHIYIKIFEQRIKTSCILKITIEEITTEKFNFMDVDSKRLDENKLQIGDYVKPTDSGIYTNFYYHTPHQYKQSLV